MTRSKELRRIERAIADLNVSELRWALAECELRQRHSKRHGAPVVSDRKTDQGGAQVEEESK